MPEEKKRRVGRPKKGETDTAYDTKSDIDRCLDCPLVECWDCIGSHSDPWTMKMFGMGKSIDYTRHVSEGERAVLACYAYCTSDREIGEHTGYTASCIGEYRTSLGLPKPKFYVESAKAKMVAKWLNRG